MTYTILYRVGGTDRCRWDEIVIKYPSRVVAEAKVTELETMGYRAVIYKTENLIAIGPPIGWDFSDANVPTAEVDEYGWWWRYGIPSKREEVADATS